jgi:hypothetical protein
MSLLTVNKYYKTCECPKDKEINKIKEEYAVDKTINMINTLNKEYEQLEIRYKSLSNDLQRYKEQHNGLLEKCYEMGERSVKLTYAVTDKMRKEQSFSDFIIWVNQLCMENNEICILSVMDELDIEVITDTRDYFAEYWDEYKDDFHDFFETSNSQHRHEYDEDDLNDYDSWDCEFQEWYLTFELTATEIYVDDYNNIYYYN